MMTEYTLLQGVPVPQDIAVPGVGTIAYEPSAYDEANRWHIRLLPEVAERLVKTGMPPELYLTLHIVTLEALYALREEHPILAKPALEWVKREGLDALHPGTVEQEVAMALLDYALGWLAVHRADYSSDQVEDLRECFMRRFTTAS
jgi:hypothetical protein